MVNRLYTPHLKHSFFLFGARGTGKTHLLRSLFSTFSQKEILWIDLLDPEVEDSYGRDPKRLLREIEHLSPVWVVVDEVQKIPKLLDLVHKQLETPRNKVKFALTGSSARKLKRGAANLLAGRAFVNHVFPLVYAEWKDQWQLDDVLRWGSLPKLLHLGSESEKKDYLRSYALTYLNEEIRMEQLVRKLDPFRSFLEVAAQLNGKQINASKIGKQVGVDTVTVQNYYQILEDTWMGFHLPGYHLSAVKSQRITPKFYWFDIGVQKSLELSLDTVATAGTSYYGELFESFLISEIYRLNHIYKKDFKLSYFQAHYAKGEVDLVLSRGRRRPILVEIKSQKKIVHEDVKGLHHYHNVLKAERSFFLSQDSAEQKDGPVTCMPWQDFLRCFVEL